MGCLSKEGQYPSTGPPTYQIIKVTNTNRMSVMKTSLTIIPMCPRERFPLYKSLSRLVLCYKKDWATLLHLVYICYLLLVTNYLITKLCVTNYFSACREHLTKNRLSFPSAPLWVRHSYLSKCHVVDVHITPLEERQHTSHQNIEQIPNSHDNLLQDFSHVLRNKFNYSQIIFMFIIRGVLICIKDLNI